MADPRSEAAIEKLRTEIDTLDAEILELVRRRFNLSRRIMTDQHRFGMPVEVFSRDREEQTLDRLKKLNDEAHKPYNLAFSIGVAEYHPGMDANALIEAADSELYKIKRARPGEHKR